MCSLNELHWGTISKYDLKISQKKSCVMQKRGLPDQMANTLMCSRWGKSFYCFYRGFTAQQNDFSQDLPSKGAKENNYNLITKN